MNFHVLTLFPDMIEQGMNTSILGRAIERGHISLTATDIRDYAGNKHNKVDDTPYGGGAGMVMQAQPVYAAYWQKKKIGSFFAVTTKGLMSVYWKKLLRIMSLSEIMF